MISPAAKMPLPTYMVKRLLHTSSTKYRGAVTNQGWYPRDHMPGNYPRNEQERRAAAIKYGLRPEDYKPYDPDDSMNSIGDYPDVGITTHLHRDPYEAWSDRHFRRNWCEPVQRQWIRYRPDRLKYTGFDEESFEWTQFWSYVLSMAVPLVVIYYFFSNFFEELRQLEAYMPRNRMPQMTKQYPWDYYRAFPHENPRSYPLLNYSFEPADKADPEGDEAKFPFNDSQR